MKWIYFSLILLCSCENQKECRDMTDFLLSDPDAPFVEVDLTIGKDRFCKQLLDKPEFTKSMESLAAFNTHICYKGERCPVTCYLEKYNDFCGFKARPHINLSINRRDQVLFNGILLPLTALNSQIDSLKHQNFGNQNPWSKFPDLELSYGPHTGNGIFDKVIEIYLDRYFEYLHQQPDLNKKDLCRMDRTQLDSIIHNYSFRIIFTKPMYYHLPPEDLPSQNLNVLP